MECLQVEFDFRADGVARYANNSNYRNDSLIRKESNTPISMPFVPPSAQALTVVCVSPALIQELKRIVQDSEIMKYDLGFWDGGNG